MPKRKRTAPPVAEPAEEPPGEAESDEMVSSGEGSDNASGVESGDDAASSVAGAESGDEDAETLLAAFGQKGATTAQHRAAHSSTAEVLSKILGSARPTSKPILANAKAALKELDAEQEEAKRRKLAAKERHKFATRFRRMPQDYSFSKEQSLVKVATRGAVTLFNAVRKQQKSSGAEGQDDVGKMSKQSFLEMLQAAGKSGAKAAPAADGTTADTTTSTAAAAPGSGSTAPAWGVLRDDFMMGSSIKRWHRQDSDEEEGEMELSEEEVEEEVESE